MEPSIIKGGLATDERGTVRFVNGFNFHGVKRFYTIENHQVGYVRAWHGHKIEAKVIYVASGVAVIGIANMSTGATTRYVLSADDPKILYIPPGYANGSMALVPNTVIVHFSSRTLEESNQDDHRFEVEAFKDIWSVIPQ